MPTNNKKSDVDMFLERETEHKKKALENASRHFDDRDPFTVNTLEAIYTVESSFGVDRRKRGMNGAAGDFQIEKKTAEEYGLKVSKENDERFDVDKSSDQTAKFLKDLYSTFEKGKSLGGGLKAIPVTDQEERKKFTIGARNIGGGRVAKAQHLAQNNGKNPEKWDDVKQYLVPAGATPLQAQQADEHVDKVSRYEPEFSEKSKADKAPKDMPPKGMAGTLGPGHWITKEGQHIFIED